MAIAQQVVSHLPYLRRYARALTGSQKAGDAQVVATLEALVADSSCFDRRISSRAALYKAFTQAWSASAAKRGDDAPREMAERRLERMTPLSRQAFLLSAMERFDQHEVAAILGVSADEVAEQLALANREIVEQVATNVLIIEDEPLIAMDLQAIMEELGHRVVGVARTQTEALAIASDADVGLILADIQLADGSSGLDAVNDLLLTVKAPVIFITAFPERLLTGQRAEPTYLVTKPYQASLVAMLSSQALFFGEKAHPGKVRA